MTARFIVEKVQSLLVTKQTVVYARDEAEALAKYYKGEVDPEEKPYYEAPEGAVDGALKVYEGAEQ